MKQRKLSIGLVTACAALAFVACEDDDDKKDKGKEQDEQAQRGTGGGGRPSNPGVTSDEVLVGMNAAFSGPSVGLGVEMWRGAKLAFQEANANGGVHGRTIRMALADDGYEAERAAPAVLKLIEEDNVFNTGWSVGTPTIVKTLPVVLRYHQSEDLFHFGCFTGAQPQRNPPYRKAVFNLRASYRQETAAMVDAFVDMGLEKIGTFVQNDAYGTDGREGTVRALRKHGLELVEDQRYERGQEYSEDYAPQMKSLKKAGVEAVIMVGSYQACGGAIRDAREMGWDVPIHNVSFVGAEQMLDFLKKDQDKVDNILENLIVSQVVPHYDDTDLPAVQQYRKAMDKYNPRVPDKAKGEGYTPSGKYSFGSLEAYLTGQVYLKVLRQTGKDLTRKKFITTAESGMCDEPETEVTGDGGADKTKGGGGAVQKPGDCTFDIGVGVPASFGPEDHQALDKVWFTYATEDGWRPTDDVSKVIDL